MPRITDEMVSEVNDAVAQATSTAAAFDILEAATPRMLTLLADLNHVDVGGGRARIDALAKEYGWDWNERDDAVPADGRGPCELGRFEAHSRRPLRCRRCERRKIDHRTVAFVTVPHPPVWPNYIDNR